MRFYSAIDSTTAEKVFATFRNSVTATATATAKTLQRNAPVVLCTHTASANGYDIQAPATGTSIVNNLFVGIVDNFPDTTTGQTGVWGGEDAGQVQVYGYRSGLVYLAASVAVAVGDLLIPDSAYGRGNLTTSGPPSTHAASTGTAANVAVPAIGGLCVAVAAVASSTDTQTSASGVFLRCM